MHLLINFSTSKYYGFVSIILKFSTFIINMEPYWKCMQNTVYWKIGEQLGGTAIKLIFAGVLQSHYHWITPIVKQTCAEFGIKYNGADTFKDVLSLHFSYLKKMGSGHHHHHDNNQDG